jgi:hypothetical protein
MGQCLFASGVRDGRYIWQPLRAALGTRQARIYSGVHDYNTHEPHYLW